VFSCIKQILNDPEIILDEEGSIDGLSVDRAILSRCLNQKLGLTPGNAYAGPVPASLATIQDVINNADGRRHF
jgi:hypothetical protein